MLPDIFAILWMWSSSTVLLFTFVYFLFTESSLIYQWGMVCPKNCRFWICKVRTLSLSLSSLYGENRMVRRPQPHFSVCFMIQFVFLPDSSTFCMQFPMRGWGFWFAYLVKLGGPRLPLFKEIWPLAGFLGWLWMYIVWQIVLVNLMCFQRVVLNNKSCLHLQLLAWITDHATLHCMVESMQQFLGWEWIRDLQVLASSRLSAFLLASRIGLHIVW